MRPTRPLLAILAGLTFTTAAWALQRRAFEGQPSNFAAGQQTGAAIWTDGGRLNVRFSATGPTRFSGKVCSRSPLTGLSTRGLEPDDSVKLGPKQRCIWLRLSTDGGLDEFSFALPEDTVIFDLRVGKAQLPPESIWVGGQGAHPDSSPFALPR